MQIPYRHASFGSETLALQREHLGCLILGAGDHGAISYVTARLRAVGVHANTFEDQALEHGGTGREFVRHEEAKTNAMFAGTHARGGANSVPLTFKWESPTPPDPAGVARPAPAGLHEFRLEY